MQNFKLFVQDNGFEVQLMRKLETKKDECKLCPNENTEICQSKEIYEEVNVHCCIVYHTDSKEKFTYSDELKSKMHLKYNEETQVCIVKTVGPNAMLKLNTIYDIVGHLEAPNLNEFTADDDIVDFLPTLHCVHASNGSLIPKDYELLSIENDRTVLFNYLLNICKGDSLAAEYMGCQLFHSMY